MVTCLQATQHLSKPTKKKTHTNQQISDKFCSLSVCATNKIYKNVSGQWRQTSPIQCTLLHWTNNINKHDKVVAFFKDNFLGHRLSKLLHNNLLVIPQQYET